MKKTNLTMTGIYQSTILLLILTGCSTVSTLKSLPPVIACDQSQQRIILLESNADWSAKSAIIWQWSANTDQGISPKHRTWFRNPTDAKCVLAKNQIITVASGGAVALVDLRTAKVVAYGYAGGSPHSTTFLPDGLIVTASSKGNIVQLFDRQKEKQSELHLIQKITLSDAHGLAWDEERDCLWALGGKQIMQLAYDSKNKALRIIQTLNLPVTEESLKQALHGGHDLTWNKDNDKLLLSDSDHLWTFDPNTLTFTPLPPHKFKDVKSISQLRNSELTIVMQATTKWWSDSVVSLDRSWKRTLPGARFYKARWWLGDKALIPKQP
jgi:hypothetical protein